MSTLTSFASLNLARPIEAALVEAGYETPTPIQAEAIPYLLDGRDLLGIAQTGTGKTAAFALPILNNLALHDQRPRRNRPRVLVLTPTRELAAQIDDSFGAYGKNLRLRRAVVFGGVNQRPQVATLSRGVDVLVATPGRLLDLMGQGHIVLDDLEVFVLDEADRMLDMGFIRDVRRIIAALPERRQTLLFSATMPDDIADLARSMLRDPARVEVTPPATTVEKVAQRVVLVDKSSKRAFLEDFLSHEPYDRALVFTRTKHGANRIARQLDQRGISAAAIHGNKSQGARERALGGFRAGDVRVLVATDIAARGIDVVGISHVVNFELPNIPESYVHRIGRTARAGRDGVALSLCDVSEVEYLRDIERLIQQTIELDETHDYHSREVAQALDTVRRNARGRGKPGRRPAPQRREPRTTRDRRPDAADFGEARRPRDAGGMERDQGPQRPAPAPPKPGRSASPANSPRPEGTGDSDNPPRRRRRRRRSGGAPAHTGA